MKMLLYSKIIRKIFKIHQNYKIKVQTVMFNKINLNYQIKINKMNISKTRNKMISYSSSKKNNKFSKLQSNNQNSKAYQILIFNRKIKMTILNEFNK